MTDEQLVSAALEKTKPLGSVRAAEALNVSRQTYARWKRGEVGSLLAQNRAHLERIVAKPEDRGPAYADGYAAALGDVLKAVQDLKAKTPSAGGGDATSSSADVPASVARGQQLQEEAQGLTGSGKGRRKKTKPA